MVLNLEVELKEPLDKKYINLLKRAKYFHAMIESGQPASPKIGKNLFIKKISEGFISENNNNFEGEELMQNEDYMSRAEKLSIDDLVRSISTMIMAERAAVLKYSRMADEIKNSANGRKPFILSEKILRDVTKEEVKHIGEFETLLKHVSSEYSALYLEGAKEVEEKFLNK